MADEQDMGQDMGVASGPGCHPCGAEPSSTVSGIAGIPNAVTISGELYAFLMGEGPLEGVWFGEINAGFRGAFWWRALLRCAAGWPASAIEAAEAGETTQIGSTEGESAASEGGDAHNV